MTRPEADQILSQIIDALVQSPVLVFFDGDGCTRQTVVGAWVVADHFEIGDNRVRVEVSDTESWEISNPTTKVRPARP